MTARPATLMRKATSRVSFESNFNADACKKSRRLKMEDKVNLRFCQRNPSDDRNWWWYYHMDRMCGSYIALFTALMVQQVGPRLPSEIAWIVWIAPAVIGSPLIAMWIKKYRRKFARTASPQLQSLSPAQ